MKDRRPAFRVPDPGFTLAEVSIAVAIAGIALMAVVGLLPPLLTNDQGNGIYSMVSAMSTQALAEVRKQELGSGTSGTGQTYQLFFDSNGVMLPGPQQARAVYTCRVTVSPVSGKVVNVRPGETAPDPGDYCKIATLEFGLASGSSPGGGLVHSIQATILQ